MSPALSLQTPVPAWSASEVAPAMGHPAGTGQRTRTQRPATDRAAAPVATIQGPEAAPAAGAASPSPAAPSLEHARTNEWTLAPSPSAESALIVEGPPRPPVIRPAHYVPSTARPSQPAATPAIAGPASRSNGNGSQKAASGRRPGSKREAPPETAPTRAASSPKDGRVDLNHATPAELSGLRGIGRVTAERIVAARKEEPFASVDALADRKILGPAALGKLRDRLTVGT